MNELEDRFTELGKYISKNMGTYYFLALLRREDVPNSWDIVIAAEWADEDEAGAIRFLLEAFKAVYGAHALRSLARIAVLNADNETVEAYKDYLQTLDPQIVEERGPFFGVDTERALVIGSALAA